MSSVQGLERPSRANSARIFQCAKAQAHIPVRNRLVRDALIQMALDPDVTEFRPPDADGCSFDFRATRCGVEERVSVRSNADQENEPAGSDCCDVVLHEPAILSEPRLSSARLVWSCRKRWVPPGDRVRILHFLTESGAPLIDVAQAATSSPDGVAAVLALVCQDLLEIDLAQASLAPELLVRRRYRAS